MKGQAIFNVNDIVRLKKRNTLGHLYDRGFRIIGVNLRRISQHILDLSEVVYTVVPAGVEDPEQSLVFREDELVSF